MMPRLTALLCVLLWLAAPLRAHEYWIEPHAPIAGLNTPIEADARVGQHFIGEALPWLPDTVARIAVLDSVGERPLSPLPGDMPMFRAQPRAGGPHILLLQTRPERLVWETREKFVAFLKEKRLEAILARHEQRGLPPAGFAELYVRYAKALIRRGLAPAKTPADRRAGLKLELVMLDDPFSLPAREGTLRIQLLWQGKPLAGADVQIFASDRPHDARQPATPRHARTNAEGIARVSVRAGWRYLVNAVHMHALPEGKNAVWISHWASLTFPVSQARQ